MTQYILDVTDSSFEAEVLRHPGAVLVDFWAEWCGPCKMLAPVLADVAAAYAGALRVAKVDADANPASMERFGVRGLPSLLLFVDGVERERLVGTVSKTRLAAVLDDYVEA